MSANSSKNDVVVIKLDRPRIVRFGHKALKTMDKLTGLNMDNIGEADNFDIEQVEQIMYCGLLSDAKAHNENLRLEDMEDLLDQADSYSEILNAMTTALQYSFGDFGDEEKNLKRVASK